MSNYLNYNLFNQIAQKSNYDKKVAAKEKDLEYAQQLEERANKRVQEQMMNQDRVASYMEQVDEELDQLLPEDQERIKELEKQKRQMVINGVASAQGDYKQFLLQGGASTLRDYKKSIMDSDQVTNALVNKDTMKMIREDMANGKILKDVNVVYNQKGKKMQSTVSVDDMITMFKDGSLEKLSYRGGAKPVDIKPFTFAKTPNPNDPYNSDFVSIEEIRDYAIASGQDPEIAEKVAKGYEAFPRNGKMYSNFQWGVKEQDWRGESKAWNRNSATKATAAKTADALGAMLSMEPTGARVNTDWSDNQGGSKTRVSIDEFKPDANTMDAIYSALGFNLMRDGSYTGAVQGGIGFTNMENGRLHNVKGSDYVLSGVGNNLEIVRDAKSGEVRMYAPINIMVTEDYQEDHLGEGAWWNGWTLSSKEFGGVTVDKDVNGNDMRELTVSVPIELNPYNRQRINNMIDMKLGGVVGGIEQENFVSASFSKPTGARAVETPQSYQKINGQVYSNTAQFGESQSDAGQIKELVVKMLQDMATNEKYANIPKKDRQDIAYQLAEKMVAENNTDKK